MISGFVEDGGVMHFGVRWGALAALALSACGENEGAEREADNVSQQNEPVVSVGRVKETMDQAFLNDGSWPKWLSDFQDRALYREVPEEGAVTIVKVGQMRLSSDAIFCRVPSKIARQMDKLVPTGEWDLEPNLDGELLDKLFVDIGIGPTLDGSSRMADVTSSRCDGSNVGEVFYRFFVRQNSSGGPYRIDLLAWQGGESGAALWGGAIARPYMPTWKGRPVASQEYEPGWGGRLRIDSEGNLPDGSPFWSIESDVSALTERLAASLAGGK